MRKKYESHGDARTRLYAIYSGMKSRCYDENWALYRHYGGKGIRVCEEWRDSYVAFRTWAMSSGYRDDLTIDRIDNHGDYSPENCRWVTPTAQLKNRSTCRMYRGLCMSEYCRQNNISYTMVQRRLRDRKSVV